MSELKACPFCGGRLVYFGKDRWHRVVQDCYKHPVIDEHHCPLNMLIFQEVEWNRRPLEDALTAENARLRSLIQRMSAVGDELIENIRPNYGGTLDNALVECRICGRVNSRVEGMLHAPDCPVTRWQELKKEITHD